MLEQIRGVLEQLPPEILSFYVWKLTILANFVLVAFILGKHF